MIVFVICAEKFFIGYGLFVKLDMFTINMLY